MTDNIEDRRKKDDFVKLTVVLKTTCPIYNLLVEKMLT